MGLDGIELILRVEETFGVTIPDRDAANLRTVGDLYAWLAERVPAQRRTACLSATAFYRVRRGLCEQLHLERPDIRPDTPLQALFPRQRRRHYWRRLQGATGLRLPELKRPPWLTAGLMLAATTGISCAMLLQRLPLGDLGLVLQAGCGGVVLLAGVVYLLSVPWATHLPVTGRTVGDVAQLLAVRNRADLLSQQRGWPRGELWETLVSIVADVTNSERAKVTPEATLAGDLGLS
jgi:acyl carrier protein